MKIKHINIKRFRSILDLDLAIDLSNGFSSICGQNNSGKTNVLRALRIFFCPNLYMPEDDSPYYKYYITRGGSVFPAITLVFDHNDGYEYHITRDFDIKGLKATSGYKILNGKVRGKNKIPEKKCVEIIGGIKFYYIESINISFPDLINDLTDDLFDIEYQHSTFRGAKADLKNAFDSYVCGLNQILGDLANDITPMFHEFKEHWDVSFSLNSDVKRFRDLISTDIQFNILDGSNNEIESKGAGLQRLAYILLHIRIIEKIKNKDIVFLIDEPDVYIHSGLQKKLLKYLLEIAQNTQIFITTHSKVFIDSYNLSNVFLLDLDVSEMYSERRKKNAKVLKTVLVPIDKKEGTEKIKQYLGIENDKEDVLKEYNILVEGETDKKYITELLKYFGCEVPNIISLNGANNLPMYLKFYEAQYLNEEKIPNILIILDNDNKGREIGRDVWSGIKKQKYKNINCSLTYIPNFLGVIQDKENLQGIQTNNEIEDFIYPEVIIYLINRLLSQRRMKKIDSKVVSAKIGKKAFLYKGILDLCENEKNTMNPDDGNQILFTLSNSATANIKTSLSNMFNIESDITMINILKECNQKYPEVKKWILKLACNSFED